MNGLYWDPNSIYSKEPEIYFYYYQLSVRITYHSISISLSNLKYISIYFIVIVPEIVLRDLHL